MGRRPSNSSQISMSWAWEGILRGDELRSGWRGPGIGRGQRAQIELAVRREGQPLHAHEKCRHHPWREHALDLLAQLIRGRRLRAIRSDIGDELLVPGRRLPRDDGGFADPGDVAQRRFDLAGFDAETAQLDLLIGAAEVIDGAVRQPAREIAGAVKPAKFGIEETVSLR